MGLLMSTDAAIDRVKCELSRAFERTRADLERVEILAAGLAAFSSADVAAGAEVAAVATSATGTMARATLLTKFITKLPKICRPIWRLGIECALNPLVPCRSA